MSILYSWLYSVSVIAVGIIIALGVSLLFQNLVQQWTDKKYLTLQRDYQEKFLKKISEAQEKQALLQHAEDSDQPVTLN